MIVKFIVYEQHSNVYNSSSIFSLCVAFNIGTENNY